MTLRSISLRCCLAASALFAAHWKVGAANASVDGNYAVDVFECDKDFQKLSIEDRQRKVQGKSVRICFQPNDLAMEDGVGIKQVDSWVWETAYQGGIARQAAVSEGQGDGILSDVICKDEGTLCVLDTILTADFFKNKGSVLGEGKVTLSGSGRIVPVQKDIFQVDFQFKFMHGLDGEEMDEGEVEEVMRILKEQELGMVEQAVVGTSDLAKEDL